MKDPVTQGIGQFVQAVTGINPNYIGPAIVGGKLVYDKIRERFGRGGNYIYGGSGGGDYDPPNSVGVIHNYPSNRKRDRKRRRRRFKRRKPKLRKLKKLIKNVSDPWIRIAEWREQVGSSHRHTSGQFATSEPFITGSLTFLGRLKHDIILGAAAGSATTEGVENVASLSDAILGSIGKVYKMNVSCELHFRNNLPTPCELVIYEMAALCPHSVTVTNELSNRYSDKWKTNAASQATVTDYSAPSAIGGHQWLYWKNAGPKSQYWKPEKVSKVIVEPGADLKYFFKKDIFLNPAKWEQYGKPTFMKGHPTLFIMTRGVPTHDKGQITTVTTTAGGLDIVTMARYVVMNKSDSQIAHHAFLTQGTDLLNTIALPANEQIVSIPTVQNDTAT